MGHADPARASPRANRGCRPTRSGARLPRTRIGASAWGLLRPLLARGEERGRRELNDARRMVGLPDLQHTHGGISRELALVATFPQLEYPRHDRHPSVRVTGPLLWEKPFDAVEEPPGEDPLVLVAPSTSQDPSHRHAARRAGRPLRRAGPRAGHHQPPRPPSPLSVPGNARVVDWLSYGRTMPRCAAVICHAGHGTVARALASGVPVIGCPAAGDMAENAARLAWAGCGISLPRRLVTPRGIRLAVRKLLAEPGYAARAGDLQAWSERNDGGEVAAKAVEAPGCVKLRGWDSNPQPIG